MKKIFLIISFLCIFVIGYSLGREDGTDFLHEEMAQISSLREALDEAEKSLKRIYILPSGRANSDQHIKDALGWIELAKDIERDL